MALQGSATQPSLIRKEGSRISDGWSGYLMRRFVRLVISAWILFTATFAMIHLVPGNPVLAALGQSATPQLVALRRRQLGLNLPLIEQYAHYLDGLLHGNLGVSIINSEPVSEIVFGRLPSTLSLALPAFVVVVSISVPLGLAMAIITQGGRARAAEVLFTGITGVFNSIPEFVLATALVAVFAVAMHALPVAGSTGLVAHVLPILALAIGPSAILSRIIRIEGLKVLQSDYIRTARGKRLRPRQIYLQHALPNMLTASLTYGGLLLSSLVAGTVIVENVFAWPGLGSQIVQAVVGDDYPLVQGIVLILGIVVLLINLTVDLVLAALDPRIRAAVRAA